MRIQITCGVSVRFGLRDEVQIQEREYVVIGLERQTFPEYPAYVRYELELDCVENHTYIAKNTFTIDLMADRRIKSWKTDGPFPWIDGARERAMPPLRDLALARVLNYEEDGGSWWMMN